MGRDPSWSYKTGLPGGVRGLRTCLSDMSHTASKARKWL